MRNHFNQFLLVGFVTVIFSNIPSSQGASVNENTEPNQKLLILMLDGFRWDYYDKQKDELVGFTKFLNEGVQAEWVEPVFPSLSYACWTTIGTGVYPETHGILGNYMYDREFNETFSIEDLNSTQLERWWQNSEPIWITATKHNKKAFLREWSRCDVAFNQTRPETCTGYVGADGVEGVRDTLQAGLESLKGDYDLVMVYGEHIDNIGHQFGPYAPELKEAIVGVDAVLAEFLQGLEEAGLSETVNIIIVGDHGMKFLGEGSGLPSAAKFLNLSDYINPNDVLKIVDRGPHLTIATYENTLDKVYQSLKGQEGFDVYLREEIPEELHYRNSRLVQDILVVTHPDYYIRGLQSPNQLPVDNPDGIHSGGAHGYINSMSDMRTIFFAKGPAFKKGSVHPPISLVDQYQIFAHLLNIPAQPNNGTWSKVSGMLKSQSDGSIGYAYPMLTFGVLLAFLSFV
ncbi:Ectonucleotide pyrophosphatase/phosphodiesterase family member 6 [Orchesella cincta]|uniref:Ectonucleotide pyrophosphatase/phosphodiesterase family member 6 n=1 Tax=Orchesella cincta TaxID=48709 RepID=A0A1D2ME02_ORCCI|nr:Ectonucleotide pyrophosphatase/phosphodiesterase family member 6 [Orchesella cincta]